LLVGSRPTGAVSADKTADKNFSLEKKPRRFLQALLTKLLTKMVQMLWPEFLTILFSMVSAVGIEPTTY
jgi:hypothetical protein